MKTIILAAGKGERLGELTRTIPKPMLKIGRKPILEHNIEWLRDYGIRDIYINLHHLPDVIRSYFKDGKEWDVNIKYSYEPKLLGTAGAVRKIAKDFWIKGSRGNDRHGSYPRNYNKFLVVYGDNLFECDLREIINFHERKKGIATVAIYEKDNVNQSGVVLLDDENRIIKFIEKPRPDEVASHFVNTGIYVLEPEVLEYISPNKVLDFGNHVFPQMTKNGENIFGVIIKGSLTAIDTPFLYKQIKNDN